MQVFSICKVKIKMEAEEFVKKIRDRVIQKDHEIYEEILNTKEDVKDSIWKESIAIYRGLSDNQKKSFLILLRLMQVNTLSHIFGILDGSSYLSGEKEIFLLLEKKSNNILNGDLQDIFLEIEED